MARAAQPEAVVLNATTKKPINASIDLSGVNITFADAQIPQAKINGLPAALAAKQPLDPDLTALAALTTDSFGLQLLTKANASAIRTYIGGTTLASWDIVLPAADIPSLDAAKITTGAFDPARIPALDFSKITTGVVPKAQLPGATAYHDAANTFTQPNTFDVTAARGLNLSSVATPAAPTVTSVGSVGVSTWSYKIVAKLSDGATATAAGAAGSVTSGFPNLSGTNYNAISWSAVAGAASYDVYRTATGTSPSTTGRIATGLTTTSFNDQGAAGDGGTAPSINSTGGISINGTQVVGKIDLRYSGLIFGDSSEATAAANDLIFAALALRASTEGKELWMPEPATLWLKQCVLRPAGDLRVNFVRSFVIKGIAGFTNSIVVIDGIDGPDDRVRLFWTGGRIDSSLRDTTTDGPTCLNLVRIGSTAGELSYVRDADFVAGESYEEGKGDSGISATNCGPLLIEGCYFRGHSDLGVYATGGSSLTSSDDWGDVTVRNSLFEKCASGASAKRQMRRFRVENNQFRECGIGASLFSASGNVPPAKEGIFTGNFFYKTAAQAIYLQGMGESKGTVVSNNVVQDYGYLLDGTTAHQFPIAIVLNGVTGVSVTGNTVSLLEWPSTTAHEAIHIARFDLLSPATSFQPSNNSVDGNLIFGGEYGIREKDSATANTGTNRFINVAIPITLATNSTSRFLDAASTSLDLASLTADSIAGDTLALGLPAPRAGSIFEVKPGNAGALFISGANAESSYLRFTEAGDTLNGTYLQEDGATNKFTLGVNNGGSDIPALSLTRSSGAVAIPVSLTLPSLIFDDTAAARTLSLGSINGTTIGGASGKLGFYGLAAPIVKPTGSLLTATANLGLVGSPTILFSELSSKPTTAAGYGLTDVPTLAANNVFTGQNKFTPGDDGTLTISGTSGTDTYFRFSETGATYAGSYFRENGSGNSFHIGVHSVADSLTASDVDAITIARGTGAVAIPVSVAIGSGGTPIVKVLSATATVNFASIPADTTQEHTATITLTGAVLGDVVTTDQVAGGVHYDAYVSATDTITLKGVNNTTGAIDPPSRTVRVTIIRF